MKLKKNLAYLLLCCALGTTAMSCSKEKVEVEVPAAVDPRIDPEKLKRIERFMVIMFGVAEDAKKYDADKEIFYVHESTITRVEMEELYDSANEYKIRYEKN